MLWIAADISVMFLGLMDDMSPKRRLVVSCSHLQVPNQTGPVENAPCLDKDLNALSIWVMKEWRFLYLLC